MEGCESGRIGTLGKRVWGNPPWVRIPLPPLDRRALASSVSIVTLEPADATDLAMDLALDEARAALAHGDVPVGAVVLVDGEVVARRHNERERTGDPTAHAELLAMRDASRSLGTWRLTEATVVVTLEPCPMCAGAMVAARLGRLVFGAADPKAGACGSLYNLGADPRLNHEFAVEAGVRSAECAGLLTDFFASRRR
jgi:tRNA(adenine34) deaminase